MATIAPGRGAPAGADEQALLGRLRMRHLRLLVALDDERNLRRAAERVRMAQPAATRLLHEVEDMFGTELFDRRPRGMEPNAYGTILVRNVRMTLFNLGRARAEIGELRTGSAGRISIGAILGAVPAVVANTLRRLRAASPLLRIRIHHAGTSDELLPALWEGRIDLAIARPTARDHAGIRFEPLFTETVCVIAASDHPLARRRRLALADLARWPWILQPPTSPMRQQIDLLFERAGLPLPDERIETSSVLATTHLLSGSTLLAAVPVDAAHGLAAAGALTVLPIGLDLGLGAYGLVTLEGQQLSPAGQRFVEALREESLRTMPARLDRASPRNAAAAGRH